MHSLKNTMFALEKCFNENKNCLEKCPLPKVNYINDIAIMGILLCNFNNKIICKCKAMGCICITHLLTYKSILFEQQICLYSKNAA